MAESSEKAGPNWLAIGAVALGGAAVLLTLAAYYGKAREPRLSRKEADFARRMFELQEASERRNEAIQRERRIRKGGLRPAFYSKGEDLNPEQRTAMRRMLNALDEQAARDEEAARTRVPTGNTGFRRR